jgi:hypothetical protein
MKATSVRLDKFDQSTDTAAFCGRYEQVLKTIVEIACELVIGDARGRYERALTGS